MIRVTVTGSECTGKTTLCRELARAYRSHWVPEFARQFVETLGRAPVFEDVSTIARGQIALEDEQDSGDGDLLFLDTDLLSTVIYSRHYYGDCPSWIERELDERASDLYLLAGIDVPWTPDGLQRDRGNRREEMQDLFRNELEIRRFRYEDILGSVSDRLEQAKLLIDFTRSR